MVGGPSQMDLFDYKPKMKEMYDKDLPPSIRNGQRLTTMTSGQARFPIAPSKYNFSQFGQCGMWLNSDLLPNLGLVAVLGIGGHRVINGDMTLGGLVAFQSLMASFSEPVNEMVNWVCDGSVLTWPASSAATFTSAWPANTSATTRSAS